LAGELRDFYPGGNVTIVQSSNKALSANYDNKYRDRVTAEIQARGVRVVLGDTLESIDPDVLNGTNSLQPRTVQTRKGLRLEADLIVRSSSLKEKTHN
jgi:NADPH-dependent 2,4-dienoyl-CoA reductase/sulfur reductase-like enzyme